MRTAFQFSFTSNYISNFVNIFHPMSLSKALAPSTLGLNTCWKTFTSIYPIWLIHEWEIITIKKFHKLSQPSQWISFPPNSWSWPCINLSTEIHGTLILMLESLIMTKLCSMLGSLLSHLKTHPISALNQLSSHTQPYLSIIVCVLLGSFLSYELLWWRYLLPFFGALLLIASVVHIEGFSLFLFFSKIGFIMMTQKML